MTEELKIRGNGKLLIAGEYFVLDGATSLAVPTKFGQQFDISVIPKGQNKIYWQSVDHKDYPWFKATFSSIDFSIQNTTSSELAQTLSQLFKMADKLRGTIPGGTIFIKSILDFPRDWGLGTSSTLVYAMAQWMEINPFELLKATFGGSGYDIACAKTDSAIFYNIKNNQPLWKVVHFEPSFKNNISFVYLGNKQNSRSGIEAYREKGAPPVSLLKKISQLSKSLIHQDDLSGFISLVEELEKLTGEWIQLKPVKEALFADFDGGIKSLGAWGGDFMMVVSNRGSAYMRAYFLERGLNVYLKYEEMIL